MLTAVVTKMRSPQTIGLAVAIPGIAVFHLMFFPVATSHSASAPWPSPRPEACSPRNEGQFRAAVRGAGSRLTGGALVGAGAERCGGCTIGKAHVRRHPSRFRDRHRFNQSTAPVKRDGQAIHLTSPERCLACRGKRMGG